MKTFILSVFMAFSGISMMAQTPVELKFNLEKGKVYTIKNISKQSLQQTVNGQSYTLDIYSNNVVSYKVLQQENDIMDIEFKFDTIESKISSPMFNKETNSAKSGSNDPTEKIMNKMSTYKIIAKISTAGKFIDFINFGKFKDSVMFVFDSIPDTKKDMARKVADALLKESTVKSMIEPFFAYLPDKAVKIGDTWETSYFNVANNLSMVVLNSYALKGIENNMATISGQSDMESMPSNDPSAQTLQEIKGSSTFDSKMDVSTGLILKNTSKGHYEGGIKVKNNNSEVKIAMDSQSEITMTK
ncbi:MAG: DUF6263 family protein [Bacteroidales bacterium]|nr:DUF6263 family protein [Bacteroidales bacterium]MDD2613234.1 DUF6263 family protein [Bacteroidales bacterium]MDD3907548.1 DUF6263 family protein [Bacteroidales bacterium]MDD4712887.1 DUF6263 family protein [Bacteroidales bacterium]